MSTVLTMTYLRDPYTPNVQDLFFIPDDFPPAVASDNRLDVLLRRVDASISPQNYQLLLTNQKIVGVVHNPKLNKNMLCIASSQLQGHTRPSLMLHHGEQDRSRVVQFLTANLMPVPDSAYQQLAKRFSPVRSSAANEGAVKQEMDQNAATTARVSAAAPRPIAVPAAAAQTSSSGSSSGSGSPLSARTASARTAAITITVQRGTTTVTPSTVSAA